MVNANCISKLSLILAALLAIWFGIGRTRGTLAKEQRLLTGTEISLKQYNDNFLSSASIAVANYEYADGYFGCEGILLNETTMLIDVHFCLLSGHYNPTSVSVGGRRFPTNPQFEGQNLSVTGPVVINKHSNTYTVTFNKIPDNSKAVLPILNKRESPVPPKGTECIALGYSTEKTPGGDKLPLEQTSLNYLPVHVTDYAECDAVYGPLTEYGPLNAVFCAWINTTDQRDALCYGDLSAVIFCKQWVQSKEEQGQNQGPPQETSGDGGNLAWCLLHPTHHDCQLLCHSLKQKTTLPPFCQEKQKWYVAGMLKDINIGTRCGYPGGDPFLFNYVPFAIPEP